jgi:hypothetical protein
MLRRQITQDVFVELCDALLTIYNQGNRLRQTLQMPFQRCDEVSEQFAHGIEFDMFVR